MYMIRTTKRIEAYPVFLNKQGRFQYNSKIRVRNIPENERFCSLGVMTHNEIDGFFGKKWHLVYFEEQLHLISFYNCESLVEGLWENRETFSL